MTPRILEPESSDYRDKLAVPYDPITGYGQPTGYYAELMGKPKKKYTYEKKKKP